MLFNLNTLAPTEIYHLMTQTVIPRPIAWVLTDNGDNHAAEHRYNLAPFSYFNAVASQPPLLMFSCGHKKDGSKKDTWHNLEQHKHCVIHIVDEKNLHVMSQTAETLPFGTSELAEHPHLYPLVHTEGEILPRLQNAPIAFYCTLHHIYEIGDEQQNAVLFCRIHTLFVDDQLVHTENGRVRIDPKAMRVIARLGGNTYSIVENILSADR